MSAPQDPSWNAAPVSSVARRSLGPGWIWMLAALWTALVGLALAWNIALMRTTIRQLALVEAQSSFQRDVLYREWVAAHGGVYVPVTDETPPNSYLASPPERDITTPSGRQLTLMNPAYMTRQVNELAVRSHKNRGHLTSLRPIRPENAPDAWERQALEAFELGVPEVSSVEVVEGQFKLRFMRPLRVTASCLRCHAAQGYREGEIRGGLSETVSMSAYAPTLGVHQNTEILAHGCFWAVGLVSLVAGGRYIQRRRRERDLAQRAMHEGEARFRAFFEDSPVAIWEEDLSAVQDRFAALRRNGVTDIGDYLDQHPDEVRNLAASVRIVEINQTSVAVLGAQSKAAIVRDLPSYFTAESFEVFKEELAALAAGQTRFQREVPLLNARAEPVVFDLTLSVQPGHEQTLARVLVSFVDVTARRTAQEARRRSEERYRLIFAANPLPMWVYDWSTLRFLEVNEAAQEHYGYTASEFKALTLRDIRPPEDVPALETFVPGIARGLVNSGEWRHRKKDGTVIRVSIHSHDVDMEGRRVRLVLAQDITDRKRAEQQVLDALNFNRMILDASPVGIAVFKASGSCFSANEALARMIGATVDQVLRQDFRQIESWRTSGLVDAAEAALQSGSAREFDGWFHSTSGREVYLSFRLVPFDFQEEAHLLAVASDITERRRAEERIREQAALLDASRDAIIVWDVFRGVQYMNRAAEELTDRTVAQAQGQDLVALLRPCSDVALRAAVQDVIARGAWSGELALRTSDDQPRDVASRWTALADNEGQRASVLITCNDISEKKRLERQYLRAQRLESIGRLASGIAHDLNNILSPVMMGAEMLHEMTDDSEARSIVATIRESAIRGSDTVRQLLTFARGGESRKGPIQPRHLLKEVAHLLQQTFPKNVQVYTEFSRTIPTLLADPSQIHQVLMNLCVNARDAMPEGGVLFLGLETQTLDEQSLDVHPKARPIPYLVFKVSDSGTGIAPEAMDRIFDPFFTTKAPGRGTGLGLATVLGIVENHGGFVAVESKPGQGTTFRVYLPASAAPEVAAKAERRGQARGQGELVLVVDDEPAIRRMVENVLRHGGYSSLAASTASDALHLFQEHRDRIRGVLADIMMPFGDGRQLITTIHEQAPKLPIIAMSGVTTPELRQETLACGAWAFVGKPFDAELLFSLLNDLLQSPPD